MKALIFVSLLILTCTHLAAQKKPLPKENSLPDTMSAERKEHSPVRSMSLLEYTSYQNGDEMGMTKAAIVNNYPSPAEALALEKALKINATQKAQLKAVIEAIDFKSKEMGRFIIRHEKELNDLFSTGKANEGSIIYYCNQIGLYQGELRNAHLQAYLKASRILTPDQLKKYSRLRGDSKKR